MTCATLSALALAPIGGVLTDRWGARRMVVVSNLLSLAGYLAYPLASSYLGVFSCVFLVMVADRLYFASWPTLIASIARPDQLDAWFALIRAVNAGGVAVGSLLSTLILAHGGPLAVTAIAIANACSSGVAAVLTATQRITTHAPELPRRLTSPLIALADRAFRRLLISQLLIATAWTIPGAFLPLYLTRVLLLPPWWTTLVTAINYTLLFTCQLRVTHAVRCVARIRVIVTGAGCLVLALGCLAAAATFVHDPAAGASIVILGVVIFSTGEMLILPSTYSIVSTMAARDVRGVYMAMFQVTGVLAFGIGPGMVGWLFEVGPVAVPAAVSALVLTGVCTLWFSRHTLPDSATQTNMRLT
jgi:MFS family permease